MPNSQNHTVRIQDLPRTQHDSVATANMRINRNRQRSVNMRAIHMIQALELRGDTLPHVLQVAPIQRPRRETARPQRLELSPLNLAQLGAIATRQTELLKAQPRMISPRHTSWTLRRNRGEHRRRIHPQVPRLPRIPHPARTSRVRINHIDTQRPRIQGATVVVINQQISRSPCLPPRRGERKPLHDRGSTRASADHHHTEKAGILSMICWVFHVFISITSAYS